MVDVPYDAIADVPPAEVPEVELYHPKSWWTQYVFSQDAKVIAIQYALTATAIGLVALVLSWLMRLQLGFPGTFSFIDANQYLQFITMHGMIMVIYLLTALFLGGFGNYLIPLMVGARDMVFPYVNMLSYWVYLLAVVVLASTFFVPGGPTGAGWTLYPPQAILSGTPGQDWGIVLMLASLILFIIGFTMGGLNYVVTVLQARTRGMTLMRLPLTVWGIFTATVMALLAFPALFVASVMMLFDRLLGTSFFMPALVEMGQQMKYGGGSPILFQHLFWFFGHPEVYIVALPAFGIVSDLISTHARKNIFGYRMMVWAIVGIGALSFVVWAHHMYVSGMHPHFGFFFATTTLIIAIPTAIKVYNWVLTLWRGDIHLTVPMLFALGFIITFVNGGLTGLFLGNVVVDPPTVEDLRSTTVSDDPVQRRDLILLERARDGDLDAFNDLVMLYQDQLFALVVRMVPDRDQASDCRPGGVLLGVPQPDLVPWRQRQVVAQPDLRQRRDGHPARAEAPARPALPRARRRELAAARRRRGRSRADGARSPSARAPCPARWPGSPTTSGRRSSCTTSRATTTPRSPR